MCDIQSLKEEKTFSNGDIYVGNIKGSLPHGKGKYVWSDGSFYEGDWEAGKMTGKGQKIWSSEARYVGDFSGGYLHGFGTFTGSDGSEYKGTWRMNIKHGLGRKQYSNSDIYEGSWKEGMPEGCGTYNWNNKNTYVGNWKGGKMFGKGVMKWENGDVYDGSWLNGLRHGSGVYKFVDGGYYIGMWIRDLKDGKGTFYPAGNRQPTLKRLNSSIELCTTSKPSVKRSLSSKMSVGKNFNDSVRISNKTKSLNNQWNLGNPAEDLSHDDYSSKLSNASDPGQNVAKDNGAVIYEREYIQGVLVKQKIRSSVEVLPKSKQRIKYHVKKVKETSCVDFFNDCQSYHLMLNLQLGIRYTVGKITPVPMREVRASDFGDRARIRMYFPRKGSQFTPPHYSIDFHWKDYCPMVFRNLREMFNLDAAEYMMSICGDNGLREVSSSGKSGSIFYLSHDDRFVIKTLKKSEIKTLLRMLPDYYNHVREHENTLITKFFGVHRITLRSHQKVRFVVMGNMFCTELRIHRRYDLKGSTQGRYTDISKIKENTTLKDLDLSFEFHMDKLLRESLFKQLSLDCCFLESQNIIDYSLLLGLHFRAPENLKTWQGPSDSMPNQDSSTPTDGLLIPPPKGLLLVTHEPGSVDVAPGPHVRGSTLRAYSAGDQQVDVLLPGMGRLRVQVGVNMPAQARHRLVHEDVNSMEVELFEVYDVVLYMGIIDILQDYNMKKKVEHAYKSLQFDPLSISAIEPETYAKRFLSFLQKVFPQEA